MKTGAKLLMVEDEDAVAKFLDIALSSQGYIVLRAKSGKEGLQKALFERPDLIILDLELPDITGFEVLSKLRAYSGVPVIILTVKNEEEEKVKLLESGADDYLTKPFSTPELLVRIKVALRHSFKNTESSVYQNGPLKIDYLARIVTVNQQEIKLTNTAYDMLKLLAQQSGKMVTQRYLLRELWGPALFAYLCRATTKKN